MGYEIFFEKFVNPSGPPPPPPTYLMYALHQPDSFTDIPVHRTV